MSVPKRLILYKVSRYQKDYPVNIKYGCHSNVMCLTTGRRSIGRKHNRKMVRALVLNLDESPKRHKIIEIIKCFPKSNGITRCWITSSFYSENRKGAKGLLIKVVQRVFRTFKYLQQVEMKGLSSLQKKFKTFKNLLLQRSLQFLILNPLQYSEKDMNLKAFLKLCQVAERRRSWPHLESLAIDDFDWINNSNTGACNRARSLRNLLEFLESFKSCETLYQCSQFRIKFPYAWTTRTSRA